MDNLPHCVMAVCWVNSQPVALAANVGQAASEATLLAAGLCSNAAVASNYPRSHEVAAMVIFASNE